MGNPRDRTVVDPPNTPDQSGVQWHYMLSEQQLIELANAVGWTANEDYDHTYEVTDVGQDAAGRPRAQVGFVEEDDEDEKFVVTLTALGRFEDREMIHVVADDGEWVVSASPKAIASVVFNA